MMRVCVAQRGKQLESTDAIAGDTASRAFDRRMADVVAGHSHDASWKGPPCALMRRD